MPLKYSQPKCGLNSPSSLGCKGGVLEILVPPSLVNRLFLYSRGKGHDNNDVFLENRPLNVLSELSITVDNKKEKDKK